MDFSKILNWRLLRGSHEFPGPDGGTCVNEAAVVAAGLPYRKVRGIECLPACFSQPLGAFALAINDCISDDLRPLLMPFVMRLAGTAHAESDAVRLNFIAVELARHCLIPIGQSLPGGDRVRPASSVSDLDDVKGVLADLSYFDMSSVMRSHIFMAHDDLHYQRAAGLVRLTSFLFRLMEQRLHEEGAVTPRIYEHISRQCVEILEKACAIGKQPPETEISLIKQRMDTIRTREGINYELA